MNVHFKRLFSEITSVCRTILRFFNILTLQQRNLDIQCTGPIYAQVFTSDLKLSRPEWKKVIFIQMLPPHINQNGSA